MLKKKTYFQIGKRAYKWTRLRQGFCNSPNMFWGVEKVLDGLPVHVYIDNVLRVTQTEEEGLVVLEQVIERLK